jgi:DNA-binding beta-propeller fold protein YncE
MGWSKALLVMLLLLADLEGKPAFGGILFWNDQGKVQRSNLDGSNVVDLIPTGMISPTGIDVDAVARKVYWVGLPAIVPGDNYLRRANFDGTNVEVVSTAPVLILSLAIDGPGGRAYWSDSGLDMVLRGKLDGSNDWDILIPGLTGPRGIDLDIAGGKLYWADSSSDKIQRANLDGTNVQDLVTTLSNPSGVALDLVHGHIYWTETDKIARANLDGSSPIDLITGLINPAGIELDPLGGKLYWSSFLAVDSAKIQRANLDGSGVEDIVTGLVRPRDIALFVDEAVVVPEPNSFVLFSMGGVLLMAFRLRPAASAL